MIEKTVFVKTRGIYFAVFNSSDRNFVLARFLDDDIGQDHSDNWLSFIERYEEPNFSEGYCVLIEKYPDILNSQNTIIKIEYKFDEGREYYCHAQFLVQIIKKWKEERKKEYPFLELNIDWEQETFSFTPLEHWIDPHKAEKDAYAQSVINKFLARVEEWKKQNPDD